MIFAHEEMVRGPIGENSLFTPWEIHPAVIHFPIAFLLGGVLVGICAWRRRQLGLEQVATGLLVAGWLTALFAALTGFVAFSTLPEETHTALAHRLMYWHMGVQGVALALFAWVCWQRWRGWMTLPSKATQVVGWIAAVVLILGSAVGGHLVYHGAAGIESRLVKPWLHDRGPE